MPETRWTLDECLFMEQLYESRLTAAIQKFLPHYTETFFMLQGGIIRECKVCAKTYDHWIRGESLAARVLNLVTGEDDFNIEDVNVNYEYYALTRNEAKGSTDGKVKRSLRIPEYKFMAFPTFEEAYNSIPIYHKK